ncbi:MAG: type II toxin-antitoxin system RelE/ParE family toxin [Proteobacteria bacterium]|nr:type II toxin-antitoxin system RelE/ParE family toxin [Pseudomonadota bacterium]
MASYRLGDAALADLDRIYEYGILTFGLEQADRYFDGLVCLFQQIADSPLSHPAVDEIAAPGTTPIRFITTLKGTGLILSASWADKTRPGHSINTDMPGEFC